MNNEEKTNKKLLDDLKNLPKVEAPKNFETELWRKINSSEEAKKENFWDKIFTPGKIAPAAVAIVSAILIFFIVDVNSEEMEDPLNLEPRLREDLIVYETIEETPVKKEVSPGIRKKDIEVIPKGNSNENNIPSPPTEFRDEKFQDEIKSEADQKTYSNELEYSDMRSDTNLSEEGKTLGGTVSPAVISTSSSALNKNSLNFMQRNLTVQEKVEVQQLKMKVESQKNAKTDENQTKSTQK